MDELRTDPVKYNQADLALKNGDIAKLKQL
jgi:hypothetical protein